MSRSDDFNALVFDAGGANLIDMTPTPLTTTDADPATGTVTATGPWRRNLGKPGTVQAMLSDTSASSATLVVEYSMDKAGRTAVVRDTIALTTADPGGSADLLCGFAWFRVRQTAIAGTGAFATSIACLGV